MNMIPWIVLIIGVLSLIIYRTYTDTNSGNLDSKGPRVRVQEEKRKGEKAKIVKGFAYWSKVVWLKIKAAVLNAELLEAKNWAFFAGLIICHFLVWYFDHKGYYWLIHQWTFWLDQVVPIFVFFYLRKEIKTKSGTAMRVHPIGKAIIVILIIGNLCQITTNWTWPREAYADALRRANARDLPGSVPTVSMMDYLNVNPEWRAELEMILAEENVPEVQRPFLLALARCESTYQMYEKDGKTPYRHRERDGSRSKRPIDGIYQINTEENAQAENVRATGYDITTLKGQVDMATWILNHEGGRKWSCYDEVKAIGFKEVRIIEAPVGENNWSSEIRMGNDATFDSEGLVRVRLSSGMIITHFEHEKTPFPERTESVSVQTVGETPVNVITIQ